MDSSRLKMRKTAAVALSAALLTSGLGSLLPAGKAAAEPAPRPFTITEVLPAPGQYTNEAGWGGTGDQNATFANSTTSGISLGSFGGYVTFKLNAPIANDNRHPYGVDFTVFGNAFSGNEEPAGVEVAQDDGSGHPGTWYAIAGSEHYEDSTVWNYAATYTNPDPEFANANGVNVPWTDNQSVTGNVYTNSYHKHAYYPIPANYPLAPSDFNANSYTYSGVKIDVQKNSFGYPDTHPNGTPYDAGSNPYAATPSQGDPIDISWAVDANGLPVSLDHVDYVRVHNAVQKSAGALGEVSPEITGLYPVANAAESVGVTADPASLTLSGSRGGVDVGAELPLKAGQYVYPDVRIDADSIRIKANGVGANDNVFVNNKRGVGPTVVDKTLTLSETKPRLVRVIVQQDEKAPVIYYLNVRKYPTSKQASDAADKASDWLRSRSSLSEWAAIALEQSGIAVPQSFYNDQAARANELASGSGSLTDYAKAALAVGALGYDASAFNGANLVQRLYAYGNTPSLNGAAFSLLALDSGSYTIPDGAKLTRDSLVSLLLSKQHGDGSFSLFGDAGDPDITAMALTALAPYQSRPDVRTAGQLAVSWLAAAQQSNGGYSSTSGVTSESVSQAIIALAANGIDPAGADFTKNGVSLIDRLLQFQLADGSFSHVLGGASNGIATEQAYEALVAYKLYLNNQGSLYGYSGKTMPGVAFGVSVHIAIEGPQAAIASGASTGATALDALERIAAEQGIDLDVVDSSYGPYLNAVEGIQSAKYGGYDGWNFAVERGGSWIVPSVGAAAFELQAGDDVVFYYGDFDTRLVDSIAVAPAQPTAGQPFTVTVKQFQWDWDANAPVVTAAAGAKVAIGTASAATDSDGVATFASGVAAGDYDVAVTGYAADKAPALVAASASVTVASGPPTPKSVQVAIEGPQSTLAVGAASGITALDALIALADREQVAVEAADSSFGKYVAAVGGIESNLYNEYDGWMYAVKRGGSWISPWDSIDQFQLAANDELLLYYGNGDTQLIDSVALSPAQPVAGKTFTVTVRRIAWDWNNDGAPVVTPAAGARVAIGDKSAATDANGVATFAGGVGPSGAYTAVVTQYAAGHSPALAPARAAFTVVPDTTPTTGTITLSVQGDSQRGTILPSTSMALQPGDTAFSVLLRQLGDKVEASGSGASAYVSGIDGLREFDRGEKSGWMYSVNGVYPERSAGAYELHNNDVVRWRYTLNMGADIGGSSGGSGGGGSGGLADVDAALGQVTLTADNMTPIGSVGRTTAVLNADKRMSAERAAELKRQLEANAVSLTASIPANSSGDTTVADNAGEAQVIVPAGAARQSFALSVQESSEKRPELVSSIFDLGPNGTTFDKPIYLQFQVPVTVSDPSSIVIVWLNEKTGEWVPIPTVLDASTGTATGKVTHFTKFAVIDRAALGAAKPDVSASIQAAAKQLLSGEALSDWGAFAIARAGGQVPASYLGSLRDSVRDSGGDYRKATDLERTVLALKALGQNPSAFEGIDLIGKLANHPSLAAQGINGPIFALLALDSGKYEPAADAAWTRQKLVDWIAARQLRSGGFPLSDGGAEDVDLTAMAVAALAPYRAQPAVAGAIDRAATWLASQQQDNGGFVAGGADNSESVAQTIIALASAGIDPLDSRFVRKNGDLLTALNRFRQTDGGFAHVVGQGSNGIATEQALLALVAYDRFVKKQPALYDLSGASSAIVFADDGSIAAWARDAVYAVNRRGIMVGLGGAVPTFDPKMTLTRAQFATLIVNLLGEKPDDGAAQSFADVKAGAWYYGAVAKAKALGIVGGVSATAFEPNAPISRQQMAIMIARAYKLKGGADAPASPFRDLAGLSVEAAASIEAVSAKGLMTGDGGSFHPKDTVTREMAAVVADRLTSLQR